MTGCSTCRFRKVKCDGRPEVCLRCEKLGIECKWRALRPDFGVDSDEHASGEVTRAGHKRLRTSVACETCRKKKLKCDAGRPSCSVCLRRGISCTYDPGRLTQPETPVPVSQPVISPGVVRNIPMETVEVDDSHQSRSDGPVRPPGREAQDVQGAMSSRGSSRLPTSAPLPTGSALLPYLDSYLSNVHPICLNNVLHPGVLCEAFGTSPRLLLLAICGVSAKFLKDPQSKANGRSWIAEAKSMVMENLDQISTLHLLVLQTLAMHDVHEADITSAWNLTGISIRMALQLKLNQTAAPFDLSPNNSKTFLKDECSRRLMWSVFGADILLASAETLISDEAVCDLGLPCNLWNFTQGTACTTLRLRDDSRDAAIHHATNPNGYFIRILALKRRISNFIQEYRRYGKEPLWLETSPFYRIVEELEDWRRQLPPNMKFEERHMYTFRTSRHLDMFIMVHVWYHQCGCDLFGSWIQEQATTGCVDLETQAPLEFLQKCTDRCLYHARQISRLLEKILKVEPHHLFRDPWITFCILDSVKIQLANVSSQQELAHAESLNEAAQHTKFNIKALSNTKATLVLADKVYQECCSILRRAGLGELVGEGGEESERGNGSLSNRVPDGSTIELLRNYPFLMPVPPPEMETWNNLFNATSVPSSMTRQASPEGDQEPSVARQPRQQDRFATGPRIETQNNNGIGDVSYMGDNAMQLFPPWEVGDFQWWQTSSNNMQSASTGLSNPAVSDTPTTTNHDQSLLEFFANSMATTDMWQVERGLDGRFIRPGL